MSSNTLKEQLEVASAGGATPARIVSGVRHKDGKSQSRIGKMSFETPCHKLFGIQPQLPQHIVSELISNPRKKSIDAKNIHIKYKHLQSNIVTSNDGVPFNNSDDIESCVLSRKTKELSDYDINDTSMYDEGIKFIVDICNDASFYSLKENILSCVKVFPKIWYEEDNYPRPTGTSDTVSIKKYDFDITNEQLSPDEKMMLEEFSRLRMNDTMTVVFEFNIRPEMLTHQEDCDINRSLEHKFCDKKTKIICNNSVIEYKSIETVKNLKTELKIYCDTRDTSKYFIGYYGELVKEVRSGARQSSEQSNRIIGLYDGLEVKQENIQYLKEIPITKGSGLYTYYSANGTPARESSEEKLKDIGGGGMENCSLIIGEKDCIYNFNADKIRNNTDHKKYHMTELKIKFPDDSPMHNESRLFLKKITDPKKYTPPNNPHFYKIIESIRETQYKEAVDKWGTKYTSVNYFKCGKCHIELQSTKFINNEKKSGGICNKCRKAPIPSKKKKKIKLTKRKLTEISDSDSDIFEEQYVNIGTGTRVGTGAGGASAGVGATSPVTPRPVIAPLPPKQDLTKKDICEFIKSKENGTQISFTKEEFEEFMDRFN